MWMIVVIAGAMAADTQIEPPAGGGRPLVLSLPDRARAETSLHYEQAVTTPRSATGTWAPTICRVRRC